MADFNEDIIINVRSDTKQAVRDINAFDEALKKMQSTMQKTEVSTRSINKWVKQLENVANPIEFANKQMDRLNKKLAKAQSGVEVKRITKDQVALMTATGQSENFQSAYRQESGIIKAHKALEAFERSLDPTREKLYQLQQKLEASRDAFVKLASSQQNTSGAEQSIKKITKQMQKLEESTQKSAGWFSKLMGRIRNIAIYRAIRSVIKSITSSFQEGLNNFAQYSESANKTITNLNSSVNQIKNTMGIALGQVLIALEPIIRSLADAFVDLINAFNLAMSKKTGQPFIKAKKYADNYAESLKKVNKLSFDAFESLSGDSKTNPADMFEEGDVIEDANSLSKIFEILIELITSIGSLVSRIINRLIDSGALDKILKIVENIVVSIGELLIDLIDSGALNTILDVITDIASVGLSIVKVISDIIRALQEAGALKAVLLAIATGFVAVKMAAIGAALASAVAFVSAHPIIGGALVTAAGVAIVSLLSRLLQSGLDKIPKVTSTSAGAGFGGGGGGRFADGGIPNKSELFWMNENGVPEALVNTGGSQTNVINIDQLSEGMRRGFVQAIYDTGLLNAMQQGSSTIVVDKDVLGRTVAESAGFRNEVNRRNVSLNLR